MTRRQRSRDAADLAEALAACGLDLAAAADRLGLDPAAMIARCERAATTRAIDRLIALDDRRTALRLARARVEAADALRALAVDQEHKETARKACVDLLRLRDPHSNHAAERATHAAAPKPDEHALRALLRACGQTDHEPPNPPPNTDTHPEADA